MHQIANGCWAPKALVQVNTEQVCPAGSKAHPETGFNSLHPMDGCWHALAQVDTEQVCPAGSKAKAETGFNVVHTMDGCYWAK